MASTLMTFQKNCVCFFMKKDCSAFLIIQERENKKRSHKSRRERKLACAKTQFCALFPRICLQRLFEASSTVRAQIPPYITKALLVHSFPIGRRPVADPVGALQGTPRPPSPAFLLLAGEQGEVHRRYPVIRD